MKSINYGKKINLRLRDEVESLETDSYVACRSCGGSEGKIEGEESRDETIFEVKW